jgi:ATP-binding cassette subfamily F protein 3
MLARMEPVSALVDGGVPPFHLPSPAKPLKPPIIAMDHASVGYDGKPVLKNLNLTIADDDRIGLLGSNGNGKSTFAKLVAGRLLAMDGAVKRSVKLEVGFFAQHQVEDLDEGATPYQCVQPLMKGASEAQIRGKCAQLGFANVKADTKVAMLSGGEKARLLMGLSTFTGPHLLILDEPTNHLDIDSRAALIEAINEYRGAVILVSHDRYLLDACADRLWQVADGTVKPFEGDMDDYKALILGATSDAKPRKKAQAEVVALAPGGGAKAAPIKAPQRPAVPLKKRLAAVEERIAQFQGLIARIDKALSDRDAFIAQPTRAAQLAKQRVDLAKALAIAEDEWLLLSAEQDAAQ